MAATNVKSNATPAQQKLCIDLPGEAVQCWRSSDNIQVVLRKHRDVIFELKLVNGRKYSVESNGSDFYNANEKKLVAGRGTGHVSFNDGDRLHLWLARDFRGELVLRSEGKVMLKIEPMKLDAHQYDDEPKTKPSPIIITLGGPSQQPDAQLHKTRERLELPGATPQHPGVRAAAASVDDDCALVCVVEGNIKEIPRDI